MLIIAVPLSILWEYANLAVAAKRLHDRFDRLRFNIEKEHPIQFGSNRGRADLVLLAGDNLIVIVECKRQGYTGSGINQLTSYLCATHAKLGIFANSPDPNGWTYLDQGNINKFTKIDRDRFEGRVWEERQAQRNLEKSIKEQTERHIYAIAKKLAETRTTDIETRTKEIIEAEAKKQVTESAIQASVNAIAKACAETRKKDIAIRTNEIVEEEAKKRVTEFAIRTVVERQLRENNASLQHEIDTLEEKNRKSRGCAIWGWLLFLGLLLFGIASGW